MTITLGPPVVSPKADRPGCGSRNGRHDTAAAYTKGCRCPLARRAQRRYDKHRAAGIQPPAYVDPTGTVRRLRALAALGQPTTDTAAGLGWSPLLVINTRAGVRPGRIHRRKAAQVTDYYNHNSMRLGDDQRLRSHARRHGWALPLAWAHRNIDNHTARAAYTGPADLEPDEAAVRRVAGGHAPLASLRRVSDRRLVITRLLAGAMSTGGIASRTTTSTRTVERLRP